jgi:hypothetical protein
MDSEAMRYTNRKSGKRRTLGVTVVSGTEVYGQCQPSRLSIKNESSAKVATKRYAI